MIRLALAVAIALAATPSLAADTAAESCAHQGDIVAAIQQARLNRVAEGDVGQAVLVNATWPETYNAAIPIIAPWVYEQEMDDLRTEDFAGIWTELCLAN